MPAISHLPGARPTAWVRGDSPCGDVQVVTAACTLTWVLLDMLLSKLSLVGACLGAMTGLVLAMPVAGVAGLHGALAAGSIGAIVVRCDPVGTRKPACAAAADVLLMCSFSRCRCACSAIMLADKLS